MANLISVKITQEAKDLTKLIAAKKKEKFYESYTKAIKAHAKKLKLA